MKTEKQLAIDLIGQLPDNISTETIITELQFRLMILRRAEEADRGENVVSEEEAMQRLSKWLKLPGT
jgi:hypothetical protein